MKKAANPNANITINTNNVKTNNIKTDYNMTFGILSGLAIIMVVAGHLGYNILTVGDLFPYYSFHVPLFMFISGYFYKETEETHPFGYVVKKARRLLMPYWIWNLVYGLAACLMRWKKDSSICLCHGLAGKYMILCEAAKALGRDELRKESAKIRRRILELERVPVQEYYNASLMAGISGAALALCGADAELLY